MSFFCKLYKCNGMSPAACIKRQVRVQAEWKASNTTALGVSYDQCLDCNQGQKVAKKYPELIEESGLKAPAAKTFICKKCRKVRTRRLASNGQKYCDECIENSVSALGAVSRKPAVYEDMVCPCGTPFQRRQGASKKTCSPRCGQLYSKRWKKNPEPMAVAG